MAFNFEKLIVYQKALDFSDRVYKITKSFPRDELFGITSQFRRASLSVSLNIAEGCGRRHNNDRRHFFDMARGSIHECVPLTEICFRQRMIDQKIKDELCGTCSELGRLICGLINAIN